MLFVFKELRSLAIGVKLNVPDDAPVNLVVLRPVPVHQVQPITLCVLSTVISSSTYYGVDHLVPDHPQKGRGIHPFLGYWVTETLPGQLGHLFFRLFHLRCMHRVLLFIGETACIPSGPRPVKLVHLRHQLVFLLFCLFDLGLPKITIFSIVEAEVLVVGDLSGTRKHGSAHGAALHCEGGVREH